MYDKVNARAEAAGLTDEREALLAGARGATIEIGAGTGLNLAHYPASLDRLVLVEPDPHNVLRYFSGASSYEEIAALCGVPLGTVRSRRNEAKRRLAEALLEEATAVDSAARAEAERCAREFEEVTAAIAARHDVRAFAERCAPDVEIRLGQGPAARGREYIARVAEEDFEAGIAYQLTNVVAGSRVIVAEGRFENPADDPYHCPPSVVQVHLRQNGWTRQIVMHYARRSISSA